MAKHKKVKGVEYDIGERWKKGTPHHPKSEALFKKIEDIDFLTGDRFCWKSGGDGDNGEDLMYILDIMFEEEDRRTQQIVDKLFESRRSL